MAWPNGATFEQGDRVRNAIEGRRGFARSDRRIAPDAFGPPVDRYDRADRCLGNDPGRNGNGRICRPEPARQEPAGRTAFIPVNCGALPENLVESELFGHRKGAFTGADTHRKGLSRSPMAARCFWTKSANSQARAGQAAAVSGVGRNQTRG